MAGFICDVSANALSITIGGILIEDFMDEGTPIEVSDTETTNIEWSCNGRMIRTIKPAAVMVSVTVIPGSHSDESLWEIWRKGFCDGGNVNTNVANTALTGTITYIDGAVQLGNGTCVSGPSGYTARGEGKMAGNTYTFAFERVG